MDWRLWVKCQWASWCLSVNRCHWTVGSSFYSWTELRVGDEFHWELSVSNISVVFTCLCYNHLQRLQKLFCVCSTSASTHTCTDNGKALHRFFMTHRFKYEKTKKNTSPQAIHDRPHIPTICGNRISLFSDFDIYSCRKEQLIVYDTH